MLATDGAAMFLGVILWVSEAPRDDLFLNRCYLNKVVNKLNLIKTQNSKVRCSSIFRFEGLYSVRDVTKGSRLHPPTTMKRKM